MHGDADRHFAGFQIKVSPSLAILQHTANQAVYFLFRFSAKCLPQFFFNCSNSFSSTMMRAGRPTDRIRSLTSNSSWDRRRNARYRSTSRVRLSPVPDCHRQISRLRLAADADVPQILRSVPRMILTRTSAVALAALAIVYGNGATTEIAKILHLAEQFLPAQLQVLQDPIHSQ